MAVRNILDGKDEVPWFIPMVKQNFLNGSKKSYRAGYFRPSSIDECARANLYQVLGVDEYPDIQLQSILYMSRGTADHDMWYNIFKESGVKVRGGDEENTFFKSENPNIRGKWDFIATDNENLDWLVEWKSTVSKSGLVWGHEVQWHIYAKILEIPRGFIIKQNPSTWEIKPYLMKYDKKFADELFEWLMMIQNSAIDKKMLSYNDKCGPGRPWKTYCDLYHYCRSERGQYPFDEYPYDRKENPFLYDKNGNKLK